MIMLNLPSNILLNLKRLVPSSLVNDIACFVFYDDHPRDQRNIDITICTLSGEVKEFYEQEMVSSISFNIVPLDIRILRNTKCNLFYLVSSSDSVYILRKDATLKLHTKVDNVDTYSIDDATCFGQALLKVVRKDDAVPLVFDEDFRCIEEGTVFLNKEQDQTIPLIIELQRKLTEAKYCVKGNEIELNDLINLRQISAFNKYDDVKPNTRDTIFNSDSKVTDDLSLKTRTPWVKFCNNKIVLILNLISNDGSLEPIEDLHLLLYESSQASIVYKTDLYEKSPTPPFWIKKYRNILSNEREAAVVCVIELNELEYNVNSIELKCVLCHSKAGAEHLSHLDNVRISSKIIMTDEFNVLSKFKSDDPNVVLAVIATSNHNELKLRQISTEGGLTISLSDVFCQYLSLEPLPFACNVFLHRSSSYHPLNGVMVVLFKRDNVNPGCEAVSVYTRTPTQLIHLIKLIYDTVPQRIVVISPNHRITAKNDKLTAYNEDSFNNTSINYTECCLCISKQLASVLEYLDHCNKKMAEDKKRETVNKIGFEINLFADGASSFEKFRLNFIEDMKKTLSCFQSRPDSSYEEVRNK